jgi:hypothetical protein
MNLPLIVAAVIVVAALAGIVRSRRAPRRRVARTGLQILAAAALYACLFPPHTRENFAADELVVLTPGATAAQVAALPLAAKTVALPGVAADAAIERVPDLGTALRRHAQAQRLRIVGGGLPERDRDAARGRAVAFDAAPLPGGVVELDVPAAVPVGGVFRVEGRVAGVADARVELRDPSGAIAVAQTVDAQGRFSLQAVAKGEGTARFALNALGADGARVDSLAVPLAARAGTPLKILLLAGAPDPELKYLRRWAADAGLAPDSRLALSEGVALTEGAPALDAQALRSVDLAVLDERSWASLDAQGRQALIDAVRDGLGLLLRATGPVAEPVAAQWAELGYRVTPAEPAAAVRLDRTLGLGDGAPALARRALAVEAPDAAPLLRADDGSPLAWSRNLGRGRVALWLLADSYRIGLAGAASAFGTLWSGATATVARARGAAPASLPSRRTLRPRPKPVCVRNWSSTPAAAPPTGPKRPAGTCCPAERSAGRSTCAHATRRSRSPPAGRSRRRAPCSSRRRLPSSRRRAACRCRAGRSSSPGSRWLRCCGGSSATRREARRARCEAGASVRARCTHKGAASGRGAG